MKGTNRSVHVCLANEGNNVVTHALRKMT